MIVSILIVWVCEKNDKLQTPPWIIRELGDVDLDPCAGVSTHIGKANWAIERGENGLLLDWYGLVFCNPPFSQKEQWIKKMIAHGTGFLLLPERGSAPWFGPVAKAAGTYWVMGKKINFIGGSSSNNIGSCIFLFGGESVARAKAWRLPGHLVKVLSFNARNT